MSGATHTRDTTTDTAPDAEGTARGPGPVLAITCFTDPLCCWSWGFEPQLRRLRFGFAGRIAWRSRMGGMIGGWDRYSDPLNDVHRPAQMGPLWIQAGTVTGMPVDATLWVGDPPASSWPACLAVRAAGLQSPAAADLYLRLVREAALADGRNVARDEVLIDLARRLSEARPDLFDAARFKADLAGREARAALDEDIREARFHGIGRFPCLMLHRAGAEPAFITGWRPYAPLLEAVRQVAPDLGPERPARDGDSYRAYWGGATAREIEVALGRLPPGPAADPVAGYSSGGAGGVMP